MLNETISKSQCQTFYQPHIYEIPLMILPPKNYIDSQKDSKQDLLQGLWKLESVTERRFLEKVMEQNDESSSSDVSHHCLRNQNVTNRSCQSRDPKREIGQKFLNKNRQLKIKK